MAEAGNTVVSMYVEFQYAKFDNLVERNYIRLDWVIVMVRKIMARGYSSVAFVDEILLPMFKLPRPNYTMKNSKILL